MKKIEQLDIDSNFCPNIWNQIYRHMQAPFFELAIKTRIFDLLDEPMSTQDLAAAMGFDPASTKPFLDVLLSMGLLELDGERYVNHPQVSLFFTSSSLLSQLDSYQTMLAMHRGIVDDLEDVLKNGGQKQRAALSGEQAMKDEAKWSRAARALLGGGLHQAQLLLPHIKALPEWDSFEKMMDLGGGPGAHCMVFVSQHPRMRGVVFDQKAVAAEARKIISEHGMDERITAQAGDYIEDSDLGVGYDFIWSCATLNFAKGRLAPVFAKIREALNPGGVFASFHPAVSRSGREAWQMVVGFAPYAMLGMDMQFYDDEIAQAMLAAGFQSVQSKDIASVHGLQRLDLARKAKA